MKALNPIRMCVVCRGRFSQKELLRLQYKDSTLQRFSGSGRSFYLCNDCRLEARTIDCLLRVCKSDKKQKENFKEALKEILIYG